ncbi:unnamed protein product, partial [Scytosiphon promiscuus]
TVPGKHTTLVAVGMERRPPQPTGAGKAPGVATAAGFGMSAAGGRPVAPLSIRPRRQEQGSSQEQVAGGRRAMSWRERRNSPTAAPSFSSSRATDLRQRTASMSEERETLRRKASGSLAASGGERAAGGEEELVMLHFQDVREELELSGHNLTSVLNNPRETFMDSLYEAAFEAEPPLPDLELVRANAPHGMREITPQDVQPFIRRTAALTKTFERNHARSAAFHGQQEQHQGGAERGGSGAGATNGPSARRASGSDLPLPHNRVAPVPSVMPLKTNNGTETLTRKTLAATSIKVRARAWSSPKGGADRELGGGGSVSQCFEQVPGMFFDKTFTLQDPAIFESAVMAAGAEQPERLAHYLDLVEVCLLKQISHRSDALFEGLKTSQDLQTHVGGACTTLYQLRESMRCMQQEVLAGPMRVPQLQRRRSNLASLETTLELVARVQQSQAAIEGLLAAEDYLGALDILQSAKRTVKSDLGKLQSLKHVGRKLTEYEELVSDLLSSRFVTLAVTIPVDTAGDGGGGVGSGAGDNGAGIGGGSADLSWEPAAAGEAGGGGSGDAVGGRAQNGARSGTISAGGDELRQDVELTVQGLLRLGEMERVLGVVQERVSEDLKLIIRTVVGDFLATTDDSGELMDTFHLFGDDSATTTTGGGDAGEGDGAG